MKLVNAGEAILLLVLMCPLIVCAQDTYTQDVFPFAMYLIRSGDYEAARVEFHRFLFLSPEGEWVEQARFRIGQCHFFLQQWDKALEAFDDCVLYASSEQGQQDAAFWSARTSFRRLEYEIATDKALVMLDQYPDSPYTDDCRALIAWCFVGDGRWHEAAAAFGELAECYDLESLEHRQSLVLVSQVKSAQTLPRRSPSLAAILSTVLPGAGQFYARQKGDSFFAALLNGLSIGLAVEAFSKGRVSTGIVASAIASTFYLGNIYGARNAAIRYNQQQVSTLIEKMKQNSPVDLFSEEFTE